MLKNELVQIVGSAKAISDYCGISRPAVSQWPPELHKRFIDSVVGAILRDSYANGDIRMLPEGLLVTNAAGALVQKILEAQRASNAGVGGE